MTYVFKKDFFKINEKYGEFSVEINNEYSFPIRKDIPFHLNTEKLFKGYNSEKAIKLLNSIYNKINPINGKELYLHIPLDSSDALNALFGVGEFILKNKNKFKLVDLAIDKCEEKEMLEILNNNKDTLKNLHIYDYAYQKVGHELNYPNQFLFFKCNFPQLKNIHYSIRSNDEGFLNKILQQTNFTLKKKEDRGSGHVYYDFVYKNSKNKNISVTLTFEKNKSQFSLKLLPI